MAIHLRGAQAAQKLTEQFRQEAQALIERGITPTLAILRVGEREDDLAYERGALKRCEQIGIKVVRFVLSQDATQQQLLDAIDAINADETIDGCLMFRPLPSHLNDEQARGRLRPEKDVDGITDGSMCGVYSGTGNGFSPCTAEACIEILRHYQIPIKGRRAVVVGRSLVIGKPVSMLLLAEHATLTICHTKTENLAAVCREAEILIVAAGKAQMLGAESVSPGQTVLDVGIHVDAAGNLCGDVRFDEVEPIVGAITPVPGGVGSVTSTVLAGHVLQAARRGRGKSPA